MKKEIKVVWIKEDLWGYRKAMSVVSSNHPRFTVGSRFDFGFFNIATEEGYTIISTPTDEVLTDRWKDGYAVESETI